MTFETYLFASLFAWAICAIASSVLADQKHASGSGFLMGLFFGPFGLIAAGLLDQRPLCQNCGGRQNGRAEHPFPVCEHCGNKNEPKVAEDEPLEDDWEEPDAEDEAETGARGLLLNE